MYVYLRCILINEILSKTVIVIVGSYFCPLHEFMYFPILFRHVQKTSESSQRTCRNIIKHETKNLPHFQLNVIPINCARRDPIPFDS